MQILLCLAFFRVSQNSSNKNLLLSKRHYNILVLRGYVKTLLQFINKKFKRDFTTKQFCFQTMIKSQ